MAEIQYNKKGKILSIRLSNRRSVDSDVRDNVVLDYDGEGKIVNVDIMQVSLDEFSRVSNFVRQLSPRAKARIAV